jgi:hypothetical protein
LCSGAADAKKGTVEKMRGGQWFWSSTTPRCSTILWRM